MTLMSKTHRAGGKAARTGAGLALLLSATYLLTSCQSNCVGDPMKDDLFCAQAGLSSGRYAADTESLRLQADSRLVEASRVRRGAERSQRNASVASRQSRAAEQNVGSQRRELSQLRSELATTNRRLSDLRRSDGSAGEIRQLELQVEQLQRDIARLSAM